MTRAGRLVQRSLVPLAFVAGLAAAQQPGQFKANVRMKNGADGSTATGTTYFGGAKVRTELTVDGQNMVVLADPSAKSQYMLMPSEKVYMQMPIGQGPVSMPITGPSDPTNPCGGGSGNTDCVKGPNESINGYDAVRWDYTSAEGARTRAWISTKLRFAVKSQDDNGSSMELSNIAEGPQPASLFGIPAGYKKMDMGAMGGMGGMGVGRGNATQSGNPIAAAMANLSPEAAAALAAAQRGAMPKGGNTGTAGSAWEKGKGWILSVTITGTATSANQTQQGAIRETYNAKYVASIPLNYGTPAVTGVGAQGPMWTHQAGIPASPEIMAKPLSISVDADSRTEQTFPGNCAIDEDPFTAVSTMKNNAQRSVSISQPSLDGFVAQAVFKLAPDLKTYGLMASFGLPSKETTQKRIDGKACRTQQPYSKNESSTRDAGYAASIDLSGLTLPASVSTITGTKRMPLTLGGRPMEATVNWTLTPIP